MTGRLLDGKALADTIRFEVAAEVAALKESHGITPGLTVVLVGNHPASEVYVKNKERARQAAGMSGRILRLPAEISQSELLRTLDGLNADPATHGILLQLPLPPQIAERDVLGHIDPRKDVDGFHPENVGLLVIDQPRFVPCTPLGIQELLIREKIPTKGASAVVLGRSLIVGKPMALLLLRKGEGGDATVTVCHASTRDVREVCRQADILIAAIGRPEHVRGDWIKPGATVIDVGIHRRPDGTLCGDVRFDEAVRVASSITPVPGGVGPLTVAMLIRNTLHAARLTLQ